METVYLLSETILGCILRHCQSLDRQIAILDRMLVNLPDDSVLRPMRDARVIRLNDLKTFGFGVVDAAKEVSSTYGIAPWEVPMVLSRDEWLSIAPPIPTELQSF